MNEHEIATHSDLDVALSAHTLRRHSELWKVAEGRSFRWADGLLLLCALFLVVAGLGAEVRATEQVVLGVGLIGAFVYGHMQRRVNAMAELVKRLEQQGVTSTSER